MGLINEIIQPRVGFASAAGSVGLIVAITMTNWGGPFARHLPDSGFYPAAFIGAAVAGWLFVGCFGRAGAWGWVIMLFGSIAITVLGAALGASLLNEALFFMHGWFLGVIAIVDAAESPVALGIWGTCMAALHLWAVKLRKGGPIPWTGPRDS